MSKKIIITEQDVDEPYEEIIEQVDNSPPEPPPPDPPPPPPQPEKQKADCKMRMRELYKCDDCGKYLTKKSLNYSHYKTCRGKPENQIKPDVKPQAPPPDVSTTSSAENAVHFAAEPKPQAPPPDVSATSSAKNAVHFAAEPVQQMTPPPVYYQQVPRQIPIYEQMRLEKQRAHLEKIQRLSMFIA
jgi:hypothetical protein